jgi:neutral amino acid transport system ATP-binding protein
LSNNTVPTAKPVKTVDMHIGEAVPGCKKKDPILVVDGVSRTFGGLKAVDVEHLEIPRGAITALIGPNGAGKTTLFNLLTGFDKPDTGSWTFEGTSIGGMAAFKVARMGQVRTFQLTKALGLLTVMDNMLLGAKAQVGENLFRAVLPFLWRQQEKDNKVKALDLLARFKLDTKKDDYAASLSGGQRKLLEMARALMSDPTLVMLDDILNLKAEGMSVLFVEHDMHMVRHIADWVIVMAEGKVVAEGDPHEVMRNQAVIDAYLGQHHDEDLGEDPDAEQEHVGAIKELLDDEL